jgi:hypothetical protein
VRLHEQLEQQVADGGSLNEEMERHTSELTEQITAIEVRRGFCHRIPSRAISPSQILSPHFPFPNSVTHFLFPNSAAAPCN